MGISVIWPVIPVVCARIKYVYMCDIIYLYTIYTWFSLNSFCDQKHYFDFDS